MLLALQLQLYTLAVAVAGHRSCVALAAVLPTSSGQRAAAGGRRICTYFNTITTTEKYLLAPCSLSLSLSLSTLLPHFSGVLSSCSCLCCCCVLLPDYGWWNIADHISDDQTCLTVT